MRCKECGGEIPVERLEALPTTEVCVRCSDVRPYTEDTPGIVDEPNVDGVGDE